ncbi:hypothetical protein [Ralstonia pseudosolanacearum]|uniref:hypothetical protein n=1 Tax=Ralstonia pseudosolanacearum TaxID=1310165 RepID=UPI000A5BFE5C|nr:hypothetical protein [Ralstonia pseudosolanacearum]MCL1618254.1 hypothetical protein [Ralstonia pseudosolanacearum CaRs-Mep]
MIKDSQQKQKAARYCVASGYVPFPEVVVRYSGDISETSADITDIDVLGVKPAGEAQAKRIAFDCKTQNKISAISRALWAAGMKQLVRADEAFVILSRAAPDGHRLAANELGVRLFSEKLFDNFAKSASTDYLEGITYLDEPTVWEEFRALGTKYKGLEPLVSFLLSEGPLERDATAGFRTLLSRLKATEGEIDPAKPAHRMLYGVMVSQALLFLSEMVREFHTVFDPAMERAQFEVLLRNYIWGGKEGYALRQRLHAALVVNKGTDESAPFSLPGWDKLVELIRSMLDAPLLVGSAALPVKDLAFREVLSRRELADRRIQSEFKANNRARQFAIQANRYLGSLSRMLRECSDHYVNELGAA